jgi:hypothetical protein
LRVRWRVSVARGGWSGRRGRSGRQLCRKTRRIYVLVAGTALVLSEEMSVNTSSSRSSGRSMSLPFTSLERVLPQVRVERFQDERFGERERLSTGSSDCRARLMWRHRTHSAKSTQRGSTRGPMRQRKRRRRLPMMVRCSRFAASTKSIPTARFHTVKQRPSPVRPRSRGASQTRARDAAHIAGSYCLAARIFDASNLSIGAIDLSGRAIEPLIEHRNLVCHVAEVISYHLL